MSKNKILVKYGDACLFININLLNINLNEIESELNNVMKTKFFTRYVYFRTLLVKINNWIYFRIWYINIIY